MFVSFKNLFYLGYFYIGRLPINILKNNGFAFSYHRIWKRYVMFNFTNEI